MANGKWCYSNRYAVSDNQAYTIAGAMLVCSAEALEPPVDMTSCHFPLCYAICHLSFWTAILKSTAHEVANVPLISQSQQSTTFLHFLHNMKMEAGRGSGYTRLVRRQICVNDSHPCMLRGADICINEAICQCTSLGSTECKPEHDSRCMADAGHSGSEFKGVKKMACLGFQLYGSCMCRSRELPLVRDNDKARESCESSCLYSHSFVNRNS